MNDIKELADAIFWDRIRRGQAMSPAERFWECAQLFDDACQVAIAGIRHQWPNASEEMVQKILADRLEDLTRREAIR